MACVLREYHVPQAHIWWKMEFGVSESRILTARFREEISAR